MSLSIQTFIIVALILSFSERGTQAVLFVVGYASLLFILTGGLVPMAVLAALQTAIIPIVVVSRVRYEPATASYCMRIFF